MKVNIVVIIYGRHHLTHQFLRTLYRNTPREMFNITVVDDESSMIVRPLHHPHKANWAYLRIEQSKHITGQARNLGIYWAERYWGRGDYLYLTDNDVYFTPGWIEALTYSTGVMHPYIPLIGGWNHPFLRPKEPSKVGDTSWPFNGDKYVIRTHDAVAGASQLMRWETWDKYGPLDAHAPGVGQSEDWKFCQDIIKDGGRVGSIYPRVVFNCGLTNSMKEPSPGSDLMLAELEEAKKQYPDLWWE